MRKLNYIPLQKNTITEYMFSLTHMLYNNIFN